jgi:hypothetical protein
MRVGQFGSLPLFGWEWRQLDETRMEKKKKREGYWAGEIDSLGFFLLIDILCMLKISMMMMMKVWLGIEEEEYSLVFC